MRPIAYSILLVLMSWGLISGSSRASDKPSEGLWKQYALELNSENVAELKSAEKSLRALPDLSAILSQALDGRDVDDRSAALLVIRYLKLEAFMPQLLEQAGKETERPLFETLRSLVSPTHEAKVAPVLIARITSNSDPELSAGSKVVILSTFRKLKTELSPEQIEALLLDENSEVRIQATALAGFYRIERKKESYDRPLLSALQKKPYQLRSEALSWIGKTPNSAPIRRHLKSCLNDSNEEVRELCKKESSS